MIITTLKMPFIFGYNAVCGALRGMRESRKPLMFIIVGALIIFSLIFFCWLSLRWRRRSTAVNGDRIRFCVPWFSDRPPGRCGVSGGIQPVARQCDGDGRHRLFLGNLIFQDAADCSVQCVLCQCEMEDTQAAVGVVRRVHIPWSEQDYRYPGLFGAYRNHFTHTGDVNGKGLPYWPETKDTFGYLEAGDTLTALRDSPGYVFRPISFPEDIFSDRYTF